MTQTIMAEESDLIAVNEVLARMVETAPLFDGAMKMLVDLANDYKNFGGDIDVDQINSLREQCKKIVSIKILADNLHDVLEETKDKNSGDGDIDLTGCFERTIENRKNDDLVTANREFQNFEKLLKNLFQIQNEKNLPNEVSSEDDDDENEENNDDVQCTRETQIAKDPFTQKEIVEGVRNRHCNHLYERDVIFGILEKNKKKRKLMKCPYVGCNNKHPIVENDLV